MPPFAQDDLSLKRNAPTVALKTTDNFKFSELVETVKDTFVRELRTYFSLPTIAAARFAETLNIEKYAIPPGPDPTETLLTVMRVYPDFLQQLPLIAITQAGASRRPIGLTGAFVDHVQYPPRVRATVPEPYNLSALLNPTAPPRLAFQTRPDGVTNVASTMLMASLFFPTPAAVSAQQLADAINLQALHARARAVTVGGSVFLEILAGGPVQMTRPGQEPSGQRLYQGGIEPVTPNRIEILSASTAGLLTALGFSVGQQDDSDNPLRPPCNRYGTSANFTVGMDVGATDDNERTEITDLLIYFLNLYWADRDFTFYGQHVFEEPTSGLHTERYFQVVLNGEWSMVAEADIPRPGGEQEDKIFVARFNIPVTVFDYVDRIIPANLIPPVFSLRQQPLQQGQPVNISGVVIEALGATTADGTGTLTYVAGTAQTLAWQAPGQASPGPAVAVGAGGPFLLVGGLVGSPPTLLVQVYASGLRGNSATAPVNVTGAIITSVSANTPAGAGTLTFTIVGATRNLQWDPPGGEAAGAVVDVSAGGLFTLFGAGPTSSIQVLVSAVALPTTNQSDTITVTTTYTDSIGLRREELPGPN